MAPSLRSELSIYMRLTCASTWCFASIGTCNGIFACEELNLQSNINPLELALSFDILAASSLVCSSLRKVLEEVALVESSLSRWHYCSVGTTMTAKPFIYRRN
jgi:hypothetical protein